MNARVFALLVAALAGAASTLAGLSWMQRLPDLMPGVPDVTWWVVPVLPLTWGLALSAVSGRGRFGIAIWSGLGAVALIGLAWVGQLPAFSVASLAGRVLIGVMPVAVPLVALGAAVTAACRSRDPGLPGGIPLAVPALGVALGGAAAVAGWSHLMLWAEGGPWLVAAALAAVVALMALAPLTSEARSSDAASPDATSSGVASAGAQAAGAAWQVFPGALWSGAAAVVLLRASDGLLGNGTAALMDVLVVLALGAACGVGVASLAGGAVTLAGGALVIAVSSLGALSIPFGVLCAAAGLGLGAAVGRAGQPTRPARMQALLVASGLSTGLALAAWWWLPADVPALTWLACAGLLLAAVSAGAEGLARGASVPARLRAGVVVLVGLSGALLVGFPAAGAGGAARVTGPSGAVDLMVRADGTALVTRHGRAVLGGADALTARRLGRIAAACRPGARRALVLGVDDGHLLAGLAEVSRASVRAVEPDPLVAALDLPVPFANDAPPAGGLPVVEHAHPADFLARHPQAFDLVVMAPVMPWRRGAGSWFSRERYLAARSALAEGGVVVSWVPLHLLDWRAFGSIARAFERVFPDLKLLVAEPLAPEPLVALVGGMGTRWPDAAEVDALLARVAAPFGPAAAVELWDLFVADGWHLLASFADEELAECARPWPELLSDRQRAGAATFARTNLRLLAGLVRPVTAADVIAPLASEKNVRELGVELQARAAALQTLLVAGAARGQLHELAEGQHRRVQRESLERELDGALLYGWRSFPRHLGVREALVRRVEELRAAGREAAAGTLLEAASDVYRDPRLLGLLGGVMLAMGEEQAALDTLSAAHEDDPTDRTVLVNYGSALVRAGRDDEALDVLRKARDVFGNALPLRVEVVLGLLEGDETAAQMARQLLESMPRGEPWAVTLERLLE